MAATWLGSLDRRTPSNPWRGLIKASSSFIVCYRIQSSELNPLFDLSMAPDGKAQKADKQVLRLAMSSFAVR